MRIAWMSMILALAAACPCAAELPRATSSGEQLLLVPADSGPPRCLPWRDDAGNTEFWRRALLPADDIFRRGQWSLSYLTGYVGVNLGPITDVPFEMLPEIVRLGCMWNRPRPNRVLRGTWEGLAEIDVLPVTNGPATIVVGGSVLLRYHFGAWKVRPWNLYVQSGFGGMYTDEYLFNSPVLSSGFEFILQSALGLHLNLGRRWALCGEWGYWHFSNGGIYLPNISVNQMGGLVGLTYYFGRR